MSTYGAKARLVDAGEIRPDAVLSPPLDAAGAEADEDGRLRTARGIAGGLILAAPIWMLVAFMIHRLL
jgi:hypothetical protein